MDSVTRPRTPWRNVLIGILAGLDEHEEPDVQEVLYGFLEELQEADPFDVALAAFELVTRLAGELGGRTGKSRAETLRDLAAAVAGNPIP
jgi:hypothetical protein